MADCLFCKIIAGELPSYTVYEDTETKAWLDIFPSAAGHTAVVLKAHGETILDYTPEQLKALWTTVQKVAQMLQKAYNTTTLSMGINHGEPEGVHHLHVHVIPRYKNDGGVFIQSLVKLKGKVDLEKEMEKIRRCSY